MRTSAHLVSLWVTIQAYLEYETKTETVEFGNWSVDPWCSIRCYPGCQYWCIRDGAGSIRPDCANLTEIKLPGCYDQCPPGSHAGGFTSNSSMYRYYTIFLANIVALHAALILNNSTDPFLIKAIPARVVLVTHVRTMEFVLQLIMACRLCILIGPEMEILLATVLSLLREVNAKDGVNIYF